MTFSCRKKIHLLKFYIIHESFAHHELKQLAPTIKTSTGTNKNHLCRIPTQCRPYQTDDSLHTYSSETQSRQKHWHTVTLVTYGGL